MAFAIVSAIKPKYEKQVLPDVETMLKSFALRTEQEREANKPDTGDGQ
jgi:hypothetical protein